MSEPRRHRPGCPGSGSTPSLRFEINSGRCAESLTAARASTDGRPSGQRRVLAHASHLNGTSGWPRTMNASAASSLMRSANSGTPG